MKAILFSMMVTLAACGGGGKKTPEPMPTEPTPPTPTETTAKTEPPPAEKQAPPPEPAPPAPDPKVVAMEAETAAWEKAKPVFEANCKGCHQKGQKGAKAKTLAEFEITTYPFAGKHANAADIKKALGIGGGKATMPKNKPGSVKGDDLAAIEAWASAWDAAEAAGAHPPKADAKAETPKK